MQDARGEGRPASVHQTSHQVANRLEDAVHQGDVVNVLNHYQREGFRAVGGAVVPAHLLGDCGTCVPGGKCACLSLCTCCRQQTSDPPVDRTRAGTKTNTTLVPCMSEADSLADTTTKLGPTRRRLEGYMVPCWTSETLPGAHACLTNTATRQPAASRPWRAETTPARHASSSNERTCRTKTTGPQPGQHQRRWPWAVRSRAKRPKQRVEQTARAGTSAPRTHAADAGWSDGGRPAENAGRWRRPVKHQNTQRHSGSGKRRVRGRSAVALPARRRPTTQHPPRACDTRPGDAELRGSAWGTTPVARSTRASSSPAPLDLGGCGQHASRDLPAQGCPGGGGGGGVGAGPHKLATCACAHRAWCRSRVGAP